MALNSVVRSLRPGNPLGSTEPLKLADPPFPSDMSVALVHDWCPTFRGGERVLAEMCRMFDHSDVYTLLDFLTPDVKEAYFANATFHTSIANDLPGIRRFYRSLFFLYPFLIEQFDVTGHDAVISSSAAFARGALTRPDQPHLCYVHSPIRYAWDQQFAYLSQQRLGFGPSGLLVRYALHRMRTWDTRTAHGPDMMVANSNFIRSRIRQVYGRDARVVFPPVEVDQIPCLTDKGGDYVTASFMAPYKRTDLVIEAFNRMPGRRLVVVGEGQQSKGLRALAGPNVVFAGFLSRERFLETLGRARAMVFAGCEDFGIALAETQAAGTPLIAYGHGGACDIVRPLGSVPDPTGVLFPRQTVDSVIAAVERFEENEQAMTPEACHRNAQRFSVPRFQAELRAAFLDTLALHGSGRF
jgi:glycosyltransferase involved in cell wall biosynthesis